MSGARSYPHPHRRRPRPGEAARAAHGPPLMLDRGAEGRTGAKTDGRCDLERTRTQLRYKSSHDFEADVSLKGQWIARYSGTNTGTGVIDLDEFDDHFSGTAVAWDDNPVVPNSFVRIRTPTKSTTQHLTKSP